jgi:Uma2 family endonuclease
MVQPTTLPPLVRGEWVPMSYEEFESWVPDGMHGEWFDGEGIVFVAPTKEHQEGAIFLTSLIGTYARAFGLGEALIAPFEVRLRDGARLEPDVLFVTAEHRDRWQGARLVGPADFVAEFVSDWSVAHDRRRKFLEYQAAGVREYLIIDRCRRPGQFDFFRLDAEGIYQRVAPDAQGRYHPAVLPGFWLDPNWFWQDPLPDAEDAMFAIAGRAYDEWLAAKRRAWLADRAGK